MEISTQKNSTGILIFSIPIAVCIVFAVQMIITGITDTQIMTTTVQDSWYHSEVFSQSEQMTPEELFTLPNTEVFNIIMNTTTAAAMGIEIVFSSGQSLKNLDELIQKVENQVRWQGIGLTGIQQSVLEGLETVLQEASKSVEIDHPMRGAMKQAAKRISDVLLTDVMVKQSQVHTTPN